MASRVSNAFLLARQRVRQAILLGSSDRRRQHKHASGACCGLWTVGILGGSLLDERKSRAGAFSKHADTRSRPAPAVDTVPAKPLPSPEGSAPGHILGRYFVANAVEAAAPAVPFLEGIIEDQVNIQVNVQRAGDKWIRGRFGTPGGSGSGFIVDEKGLIVTNAHLFSSCYHDTPIRVTLHDGRDYPGKIHSVDVEADVAVVEVKTQGQKLPVAKIGQSSRLRPGEWVVAVGSPHSLNNTVTVGIVSAVARSGTELGIMNRRSEFIQTDAAINQGNSGGPLVNLDGEVVAINSIKAQYANGIGFAIPIDIAWQVAKQLIKYHKVRRPYLGLVFQCVEMSGGEGRAGAQQLTGMLVIQVKSGSPAEKAGFQEGDVVVEVDGHKVLRLGDISERIGQEPGMTFPVKVFRDRSVLTITITSGVDENLH